MIVVFALFFLLLGFIGGIFTFSGITIDMLRESAKNNIPLIGKYRITLLDDPEQE